MSRETSSSLYFDAVASGLVAKPHAARRRARNMAKLCPYADVAAAGLARVKAAIEAHVDMVGLKTPPNGIRSPPAGVGVFPVVGTYSASWAS